MGGSVPYMSPEQIRDNRSVDLRSDIYSFGVVLYEMLTGVLPFRVEAGETEDPDYLIKHKHRYAAPVPPSNLNPLVTPALDRAVLRALEKDRNFRHQNCAEFISSLHNLAEPAPKRVTKPPSMPLPDLRPSPESPSRRDEVWFRAGTFLLTVSDVLDYLPWILISVSVLIVLISLYFRFR
jgi:serine/threonine protein kinase